MTDMRTQIAATLFRPAPDGYVYREPYRWPFGQARHYLVTADQRDALLAMVVPKRPILWQVVLWGALCIFVAIACAGVWLYTGDDQPTTLDTFAMFVLTVAQVLVALAILFWWKRRRLRALLATLTPTDLRITRSEVRAAATNAMSGRQLVIAAAAGAVASVAMLADAALQFEWGQPMALLWFAGAVIFASLAWYYFQQLIARAKKD